MTQSEILEIRAKTGRHHLRLFTSARTGCGRPSRGMEVIGFMPEPWTGPNQCKRCLSSLQSGGLLWTVIGARPPEEDSA